MGAADAVVAVAVVFVERCRPRSRSRSRSRSLSRSRCCDCGCSRARGGGGEQDDSLFRRFRFACGEAARNSSPPRPDGALDGGLGGKPRLFLSLRSRRRDLLFFGCWRSLPLSLSSSLGISYALVLDCCCGCLRGGSVLRCSSSCSSPGQAGLNERLRRFDEWLLGERERDRLLFGLCWKLCERLLLFVGLALRDLASL